MKIKKWRRLVLGLGFTEDWREAQFKVEAEIVTNIMVLGSLYSQV